MRFNSLFSAIVVLSSTLSIVAISDASTVPSDDLFPFLYLHLYQVCKDGGPNSYVGVRYSGRHDRAFNFGECYPYEIDGNIAEMAVFCQSAICYNHLNLDCSGGAVPPVPILLPKYLTLANVANLAQLLGQGATCQSNGTL